MYVALIVSGIAVQNLCFDVTFQDLNQMLGKDGKLVGDRFQVLDRGVPGNPTDDGAIVAMHALPGRRPLPFDPQRNALLKPCGDDFDDVAPGERDPFPDVTELALLGLHRLRKRLELGRARNQGREIEAKGLRERTVAALAGVALAVGTVPADDDAGIDEGRQVTAECRLGHPVRPQGELLVRREDDEIVSRQHGLGVKGEERVEDGQRARKTFHLCAAASGARCFATIWLATWPSDSDRRPKGVVGRTGSIRVRLRSGKKKPLAETASSLDNNLRRPYSLSAKSICFVGLPGRRRLGSFSFVRVTPVGGRLRWGR